MFQNTRDNRLNYGSPSNIPSGIHIGICGVPARQAFEHRLASPVAFLAATTIRAGAARVTRINQIQDYPGSQGFVLNLISQLKKSPVVQFPSHGTPHSLSSFTDARKVLEFDSALSAFGVLYDGLADAMILVAHEAGKFAREFLKTAFRASRALALQTGFVRRPAFPNRFNSRPAVLIPVRVGCQVHDSEIDTQKLAGINRFRIGVRAPDVHVPVSTLTFDQLPTLNARGGSEQVSLVVADVHFSLDATVNGGQRNDFFFKINRENPLVIINAGRFEPAGLVAFAFSNPCQCANGKVRAQSVPFSNQRVAGGLKLEFVPDVFRSRNLQCVVAGSRKLIHGFEKAYRFTRTGLEFAFHAQEGHLVQNHITRLAKGQRVLRTRPFSSPCLKAGASQGLQ